MNEFVYGVRNRKEGRRNELRSVCWRQIMLMKSLCLFVCFQNDSMSHSPSLFSLMNHPLSTLYTFAILNPYTKSILIPFLRSFHKQSFLSITQHTRRTCSITRLLRISRFVCSNKQHKTTDQFNMDHFSPIQTIISFF